MLTTLAVIVGAAALYWFPLRRWFARWGATGEDVSRVMAGDAVIPHPTHSATHAVTVDAPAQDVWPWLVQLGYRRGGLYSYDWLDRLFGFLDRPSADRVLPEFQHLAAGDTIRLGPREALTVAAVAPFRALVLRYLAHGFEWVWQFGLYPLDGGRTRLVSRGTEHYANSIGSWLFMRVMEPAAFIMTRRMLLGVKERAEALSARDGRRAADAAERRTGIEALVTRHPATAYFVLTFAISWGGALVAIGGSGGMRGTTPASDPRFVYALIAMLAGPSVAGLVLTALVRGRAGLRGLLSRLLTWRVSARRYAVALLAAPAVMIATLLALALISPAFLPGIIASDDRASLLLVSLAVGLSAGVFEELGWTGFAIPALRKHHGVLATGLIVGVWWSAWHLLPNIWSSNAAAGDLALSVYFTGIAAGVFAGYLTAFRTLMVWVYDRTHSLFLSVLMHASLTTSLLILNPLGIAGANLMVFSFVFAAAIWVVSGVILLQEVRTFARSHPVLSYYVLVFTISWGGILALAAPGGIPGEPDDVARLFPLALAALFAGPSVAGVTMTALVSGRAGVRELITRLLRWRAGTAWWAAALLTGPVLVAGVLFGLSLYSTDFVPGLLATEDKLGLLVFGLAWGLAGGGLLEELGWTGFAVPTLRRHYGALATGLIVGLLWGTWHLLIAFWASRGLAGDASPAGFVAGFAAFYFVALPAYRVLMVWVYDHTASLPLAMLMHAVLSASTIVLQPISARGQFTWNLLLGAALWAVVAVVAGARGSGLGTRDPGLGTRDSGSESRSSARAAS